MMCLLLCPDWIADTREQYCNPNVAGVYKGVENGSQNFRLQALACHVSSLHYVAHVRLGELWVRLDDTKATIMVMIIGQLEHVLDECCRQRMQP